MGDFEKNIDKDNIENLAQDIDMAWDSVFINNYEETRNNIETPSKEIDNNYNISHNQTNLSPVILPKKAKKKLPKLNIGKASNKTVKASFMEDEEEEDDEYDDYY